MSRSFVTFTLLDLILTQPFPSFRFNAHVYCSEVRSAPQCIDYIYKIKGSKIIATHARQQTLGVYEANWIINSFSLSSSRPAVMTLEIKNRQGGLSPMLLSFFRYCRQHPTLRVTYAQAPEQLTWTDNGNWIPRGTSPVIGR